MGNSHHKKSKDNRNSNCSVYNLSLESNNHAIENIDNSSIDSDFDIKNDLKKKINLPMEKDIYESEIQFDDKEEEIKDYFFLDEDAPPSFHLFRSKTCVNKNNISLFNAPKQKIKVFDEHLSPFNLNSKNFGGTQINNKKPNDIILDFRKNLLDSKSCNDNQNNRDIFFDDFLINSETERTTPNIEDFQDLQLCRKKMAIFRDSIDNKSDHSLNDNEKINYIFSENKNQHHKNNKFWVKYIKMQMNKSKLSQQLTSISPNVLKKSETLKINNSKNNDLFILGVLENAKKDKKLKKMARYTSNI